MRPRPTAHHRALPMTKLLSFTTMRVGSGSDAFILENMPLKRGIKNTSINVINPVTATIKRVG